MPAPSPFRRLSAGLSAAGVAGALLTPALLSAPATAAPGPCATPAAYGAQASAEMVKLGLLDLRPLGGKLGPVADVRIATARSGMAADAPVTSAAAARVLDATLVGAPVVATTEVHQQTPPNNDDPVTDHLARINLGVLRAGAGDVRAHATWAAGMACGAGTGKAGESAAQVADLTVLPGLGGRALVSVPGVAASRTNTETVRRGTGVHSTATASVGLAEVRLLGGAVTVKVIKPPTLTVSTAGTAQTAEVSYASPILEVSGPGIPTQRLDAPGSTVDVPVAGTGLSALLDGPGSSRVQSAGASSPLELPGLPDLVGVPRLPEAGALIGGNPLAGGDRSLLRLSLGELQQEVTDRSVRAQAASLRLQVLAADGSARSAGRGQPGYGQPGGSVVDLGIGLLDAAATAPEPTAGPDAGGNPGGGGPDDNGGTDGGVLPEGGEAGGLPVTGASVGWVLAAGGLLLGGGATLIVMGRRRRFEA